MEPGKPSRTALATAFLRALHRVVDDAPPVFDDSHAVHLLPAVQARFLERLARLPRSWTAIYRQRYNGLTGMRSHVVVRARYAEDALAGARQRGAMRYVVLAAGLDTYALRTRGMADAMPVVEIDHPATQTWKRQLLAGRGLDEAAVRWAPVDFERTGIESALGQEPLHQFVSWLGTTYYLSREAIAATLSSLARCSAPGSELVLDYWREPPLFDPAAVLLWGTRVATAFQREPMRSFFTPGAMEALVVRCGWHVREHCAPLIQDERYLTGRRDGLSIPSFAYLLHLERGTTDPLA
ncbi:MAG: class I SAM-dependent methyltransferase [Pseudomonadales bacterium]|nr:class I SAM-dependent methyltransferase [Pseudomonadales bacterium]